MTAVKYLTDTYPATHFTLKRVPRFGPWGLIRGQSPTGYGKKIPTDYLAHVGDSPRRTRRVYCCRFSNAGSLYVLIRGERFYLHNCDIPPQGYLC
jgi:hypothetical protein